MSDADGGAGQVVMESAAQMVSAIPLALTATAGVLRLAGGRLTFTDRSGVEQVDLPVAELHSVAVSAMGVTVWIRDQRFRFATGTPRTSFHAGGVVGAAAGLAELPGDLAKYRADREAAFKWVETLTPLTMAQPPAGISVKKPWKLWQWVAAVTGGVCAVAAIFTTFALLLK